MRIFAVAVLLVLAFGAGLYAQADTGSVSYAVTLGECRMPAGGSVTECVLERRSNGANAERARDLVVLIPHAGGAITTREGRQVAASTPGGITSTCGACPAALAAQLSTFCTAGNGKCDP